MTNVATIFKALQRTLSLSRSDEQVKNVRAVSARCTKVQILEEIEAKTEASAMLRVDGMTARSNDLVKNAHQIEQ